MKILIYSHFFYPSVGGVESAALMLAKYLTEQGVEVTVVTMTSGSETSLRFPFKVLRKPRLLDLISMTRKVQLIYTMGFNLSLMITTLLFKKPIIWDHPDHDLICPKNIAWDGVDREFNLRQCVKCLKKDWPMKYVAWLPISLILRRALARFARVHVVHSSFMFKEVEKVLGENDGPPVVNLPRFTSIPYRVEPQGTHKGDFKLLFAGRLIPEKGVQTLLMAMGELRDKNMTLDVVGDGRFRLNLEKLTADLALGGKVTFHGKRSRWETEEMYDACDTVVVPSLWHEPFGQVALEAMAHGKPVIVSRSGGLPEVVLDAGLFFNRGNHLELARNIEFLLRNPSVAQQMAKRGQQLARNYSTDGVGERYLKLFRRIVRQNAVRTSHRFIAALAERPSSENYVTTTST